VSWDFTPVLPPLPCFRTRSGPWRFALWFIGAASAIWPAARGHEAFSQYIWHRAQISVNAKHVDVTLELTFFEVWSTRERRRMDANRDGRVQRSELDQYTTQLRATVQTAMSLRIGGECATLIPLYDPEISLLGSDIVEGGHHQLTLRFFAPLPDKFAVGSAISLEERLWSEAQSLAEFSPAPDSVGRVECEKVADRVFSSPTNEALHFTARLIARAGSPSIPHFTKSVTHGHER
jgi:hypothetical protein